MLDLFATILRPSGSLMGLNAHSALALSLVVALLAVATGRRFLDIDPGLTVSGQGCFAVFGLLVIAIGAAVAFVLLRATDNIFVALGAGIAASVVGRIVLAKATPVILVGGMPGLFVGLVTYLIVPEVWVSVGVGVVGAVGATLLVMKLAAKARRENPPQPRINSPAALKHTQPKNEFNGPF